MESKPPISDALYHPCLRKLAWFIIGSHTYGEVLFFVAI